MPITIEMMEDICGTLVDVPSRYTLQWSQPGEIEKTYRCRCLRGLINFEMIIPYKFNPHPSDLHLLSLDGFEGLEISKRPDFRTTAFR